MTKWTKKPPPNFDETKENCEKASHCRDKLHPTQHPGCFSSFKHLLALQKQGQHKENLLFITARPHPGCALWQSSHMMFSLGPFLSQTTSNTVNKLREAPISQHALLSCA